MDVLPFFFNLSKLCLCSGEVRKRNEQLRLLVNRLKISECNHSNKDTVIEDTKSKLVAAENAVDQSAIVQQDLKVKLAYFLYSSEIACLFRVHCR